jgi:hypothetical protein
MRIGLTNRELRETENHIDLSDPKHQIMLRERYERNSNYVHFL